MTKIITLSDTWFNPTKQHVRTYPHEGYCFCKQPRKRTVFVTTEGVSFAVFRAAYLRGFTPSRIRRIWVTVGQHFAAQTVEATFKGVISDADLETLFHTGYCVAGGPILLRGGRKCVAIRVLGDLLHREIRSRRITGLDVGSSRKSVGWFDFTDSLTGLLVKAGLADETLMSDFLATELGL
ncbi:hypothetical protein QR297_12170 [Pseudomonas shirazica]|uniref:Uncharacterized protein n=1 Tax=Pseudomonas shirazica TaxID=1940636 RepID=A0ABY9SVE7_9PSED|nr:hypothetical protein [Pseudomonas shirazica]WMY87555.1 hypothetical protein QR297_12170 [Pseudomonas shirazica]